MNIKNLKNPQLLFIVLGVAITLSIFIFFTYTNSKKTEIISYNNFLNEVEKGNISEVTISQSPTIQYKIKNSNIKYETDNPRNSNLKEMLLLENIKVKETNTENVFQGFSSVIFISLALFLVYKTFKKNNKKTALAVSFNSESTSTLNFTDVAGNDEAKESVFDIIDFIKKPDKYSEYGARMPKGIILYGPPGTGKTLMAKAIAGEANVPFYAVSGSDFDQMYVGVGASRIRDLFKKASLAEKAVIFIDEIDAIGKKRSSDAGGSGERDQTLNALLTEMSGFSSSTGIVVIAATNRLDTLDEALLRPGRFDRHIEIGLPDINARKRILEYHSKNKPMLNVDIDSVAKETVYFSGAMLENLVNEAAILAAKGTDTSISNKDFENAYYTILAGSEKKDRTIEKSKDKEITAFHEAGHALLTKLLLPENSVRKVTIIPTAKGAGGYSLNIPNEKMYHTKKELEYQVMINFAGRAAELLKFGADNITTGAVNDIEKATSIIKDYVTKYGMGKTTGMLNSNFFKNDSEVVKECSSISEALFEDTLNLLTKNIGVLNEIADNLLEKETLYEVDIDNILLESFYIDSWK